MIEPVSITVGLIVGGGLGVIAGGLFAGGSVEDLRQSVANHAIKASADDQLVHRLFDQVQRLTARNREYALERDKIAAQRRAAGDKGRATQAANRAAEKAKSDELHESMRAEHRELVELI